MARNPDFEPELADISGWSLFWKKCAMDCDNRTGMLFGIFITIGILIIATAVVIFHLDDVEQIKAEAEALKVKQEIIEKYIEKGLSPGHARCLAETNRYVMLDWNCETLNSKK